MPGTYDPYTARLFQVEGGGNPNAPATGSNRGVAQFGPEEERMYRINDSNRTDLDAQAAAVAQERARHEPVLTKALGRAPEDWEHYFTHQQGIAGGPALLTADPNTPAWQVLRPFYKSDRMAQLAVTGNIGNDSPLKKISPDQISAGAFSGYWRDKFNSGMPGYGNAASAPQMAAGVPAVPGQPAPAGGILGRLATALQGNARPGDAQPQPPSMPAGGAIGGDATAGLMQSPQFAPMQMPAPLSPLALIRQRPIDYAGIQQMLSGRRGIA